MISVEKPGSPSEILEHHGTKGMKWGVQKRVTSSGAFKRFSKASDANVQRHFARQTARRERKLSRPPQKGLSLTRSTREFVAQHPTAKLRANTIHEARKEAIARQKTIRKTKDSVEKARLLRDHMNNPGTAVALRMTRGEKIAASLLYVSLRNDMPISTSVGVGLVGGRAAQRRSIERRQRKGGFK